MSRRVVLVSALALGVLLALSVRFSLTFEYLVARFAILIVTAYFLGRCGLSRTRTLVNVVGLSVLEQAFFKTALIAWLGPPEGIAEVSPLGLFVQMAIGAVAFLPVVMIFALGGYEFSKRAR